jgi:hypothetical protein
LKTDTRRIEVFEAWYYRKMLKINWTDRISVMKKCRVSKNERRFEKQEGNYYEIH